MLAVYKRPDSKIYWTAWRDEGGKLDRKSTKCTNRSQAQKAAAAMTAAFRRRKVSAPVREVCLNFHREATGEAMPETSLSAYTENWLAIGIGSAGPMFFWQRGFGLWAGNAEPQDGSSTGVRSSSRRISLATQWVETISDVQGLTVIRQRVKLLRIGVGEEGLEPKRSTFGLGSISVNGCHWWGARPGLLSIL